jgi:DNA-directed RNA polymerase subunit RPC12/RpoP
MTYRCDDCHSEFKKPHRYEHTDLIEYWGFRSVEVTHVTYHCPECGNEDYIESPPEEDEE